MTSIQSEKGQLFYSKLGTGSKILLAFHGFGQDNKIFKDWVGIAGETYTIFAFDLFYHGNSTRNYNKLSKNEWKSFLHSFLEQEQVDQFSILGFSLGGRFAITSALSFPNQTEELILLAPDGIFLTLWFKLATNPAIKWLFKYFMVNPGKLDKLLKLNDRYKLVSPYLGDFVRKEMGDSTNRKRVYISWNYFKSLGYSKKRLIRLFRDASFKRRIILGDMDHIIKPDKILPLIGQMGNFHVDILPMKHHQLIKPEVAQLIVNEKKK